MGQTLDYAWRERAEECQTRYLQHLVAKYAMARSAWTFICLEMELERRYHLYLHPKYIENGDWEVKRWLNQSTVKQYSDAATLNGLPPFQDPMQRVTGRAPVSNAYSFTQTQEYLQSLVANQANDDVTDRILDGIERHLEYIYRLASYPAIIDNSVTNPVHPARPSGILLPYLRSANRRRVVPGQGLPIPQASPNYNQVNNRATGETSQDASANTAVVSSIESDSDGNGS